MRLEWLQCGIGAATRTFDFFALFTFGVYPTEYMATLIKIRVSAGAKNERIRSVGDRYEISVREKAEGGRANARALEVLAEELGIPRKRLRIVRGHRSPAKIIEAL